MKKLFGNKIISIVLAFSFLCGASLWAQSADDDFDDFDISKFVYFDSSSPSVAIHNYLYMKNQKV